MLVAESDTAGVLKVARRKTHNEFVAEMASKNPDIKIEGTYIDSTTSIDVRCLSCGNVWHARPAELSRGKGCPECARVRVAAARQKTPEQFLAEVSEMHPTIEILEPYVRSDIPIKVRCTVCGNTWRSKPNTLLNGHGCRPCSFARGGRKHRQSAAESFYARMKDNDKYEVKGVYRRSDSPIEVQCRRCGTTFDATPTSLLNDTAACPRCSTRQSSFMEKYILNALKSALGEDSVISRDRSTIGMELDIYLPDMNLAIEPGGWVWHQDKLSRDEEKRTRCEDAGIRLVTIYDACPLDKAPFEHDCLIFAYDLGSEDGHVTLKRIVSELLDDIGRADGSEMIDWAEVELVAYDESQSMTTEMFAARVATIDPTIQVVGEYQGANRRIDVCCLECGYEWSPYANNLVRGQGCPKCHGAWRRSTQEFVEELRLINPTIEVLGEFLGRHQPIEVRCKKCGREWTSTPGGLLKGDGCARCSGKLQKTTASFAEDLAKVSPDLLVIGEYVNSKTPILVRDSRCGHEWSARPNNLLNGSGCPVCGRASANKKNLTHAKRRTKTTEQFRNEVAEINPDVLVIGEYVNNKTPVECHCLVCSHVWSPYPTNLLRGSKCPNCSRENRRRTV